MYPRLSDLFTDLFGFNFPIPIYSFGFMVAVGAMFGAWILQKDLDRMYGSGLISGVKMPDAAGGDKKSRKKLVDVSPSFIVGTITLIIIGAGFAGARIFHIFENFDAFMRAPAAMIFTSGGFTFYGGMIVGGFSVVYYVRKKGLSVGRIADAMAPGVMIAYGIGRIGCHLSGDGDWGIASDIASKPGWLPTWMWAETYPNNILGIDLSSTPVYPTPLYEFFAAVMICALLWSFRRHNHVPGWLFSVYLVFNGAERFFIEKIRVNNTFDFLGQTMTQAELIALIIILVGLVGIWKTWKAPVPSTESSSKAAPTSSPE